MLMLTACFFPLRSKRINSHWSLRYSSIYLFSQKTSPFTSKAAFTNNNSVRKLQENARFKNSRLILNALSFSRLQGSFLFTIFISLLFCSSFPLSYHPCGEPASYCPQITPASRQASCVSPHCCLDITKASPDAHFLTVCLPEFWSSQAPCSYLAQGC